jgi:hypothetical protein
MGLVQSPHQTGIRAGNDFDYAPLRPPTAVYAARTRHHAVAVQHLAHFFFGQKQVRSLYVGHQETVAVRMPLDAAGYQVELARHQDRIATVAHDLAFALHRAQPPAEAVDFVRLQVQQSA